jgi:hypothetical protein
VQPAEQMGSFRAIGGSTPLPACSLPPGPCFALPQRSLSVRLAIGHKLCRQAAELGQLAPCPSAGVHPVRGQMEDPHVPQDCPQAVVDLYKDCMALDPAARPTARYGAKAAVSPLQAHPSAWGCAGLSQATAERMMRRTLCAASTGCFCNLLLHSACTTLSVHMLGWLRAGLICMCVELLLLLLGRWWSGSC